MELFAKKMLVLILAMWLIAAGSWSCDEWIGRGQAARAADRENMETDGNCSLVSTLWSFFSGVEGEEEPEEITRSIPYPGQAFYLAALAFFITAVIMAIRLLYSQEP